MHRISIHPLQYSYFIVEHHLIGISDRYVSDRLMREDEV